MLTLVRLRLNMLEVTPKLKRVWHPCPTWYWKNCVWSPATVPGNAKTPSWAQFHSHSLHAIRKHIRI